MEKVNFKKIKESMCRRCKYMQYFTKNSNFQWVKNRKA